MSEQEKALTLIKQILSDDDINIEEKLNTLSNTVNYNSEYINPRNINIRIFSETEALMGVSQDLDLLDNINQVDQVRYIFTHEKENTPIYIGRYDGFKDEFVITRKGLELFFPLGSEFIYTIIKKCKIKNSEDKSKFKDILESRKRQVEYEIAPEKMVEDGMQMCVCCKCVYPLTEDYFSKVGGVISKYDKRDVNGKMPKKVRGKYAEQSSEEVITLIDNDMKFLNICKKCEMVRVNEEFYRQRLRDKKGQWLKKNTLMSTNEILTYDIDKLPNLNDIVVNEIRTRGSDGLSECRQPRIRCVETGKIFVDEYVASNYLSCPHNASRIRKALDNPNKIAAGYHWITMNESEV